MTKAPPSLRQINWAITYLCNSRCVNCHLWDPDVGRNRVPLPELTLSDYRDFILNRLPESVTDIAFGGGEPTIHPHFEDLLRLPPKRIRVTFSTNAVALEKALRGIEVIRERGDGGVQVSIDGIGDIHDTIRGVKGNFEKAVRFLEAAQKADIFRTVSFTINRRNVGSVWDTYCLARDRGAAFAARPAEAYAIYGVQPDEDWFKFSADDIAALKDQLARVNDDQYGRTVHPDYTGLAFRHLMPDYLAGRLKGPPCHAVSTACKLDPYGQVLANCEHCPGTLGNIRDHRLEEIWRSEKAERLREYALKLECAACWNDCQVLENLELEENLVLGGVDEILKKRQRWDRLPWGFAWISSEDRAGLGCGWTGILPAPEGLGGRPCRYAKRKAHLFMRAAGKYFYLNVVCPGERGKLTRLSLSFHGLNVTHQPEGPPAGGRTFDLVRNRWRTLVLPVPPGIQGKNTLVELETDSEWKPHASWWPTGCMVRRAGFTSAAGGLREWAGDKARLAAKFLRLK